MYMMILTSSVLILLMLCLRPFMKKRFSPVLQYALWGLVALRLLIPVQLWQSPLSLENFAQTTPAPIVEPQENLANNNFQSQPSVNIPQVEVPNVETVPQNNVQPSVTVPDVQSKPSVQPAMQKEASLTTEEILNSVWFAGCLAMALWFLWVNVRFARKAKEGARKIDGASVPVYESENVPSPCLVGLIKPRIYLLPCEDASARKHILTHEQTHYRHGDHIWSVLRSLCLCVYWFNPLVWVAAYLSKEDCEAACDQGAITTLGEEERIPYGRTLLQTLVQVNRPAHLLRSATTMGGGKQQIKNRLERIVSKPKKALWAVLMLIVVLCICVGCTFTGATDPDVPEQNEVTEPTTEAPQPESTTTEGEEPTPSEDKKVDIQVVDYINDGNIRIPQFVSESSYCEKANGEIRRYFENHPEYVSIDYAVYYNPWYDDLWGEIEVLSLVITAKNAKNEPVYAAFNVNLQSGDKILLPYIADQRRCELFGRELYHRYNESIGTLPYTEEDHARLLQNLNHTDSVQGDLSHDSIHWLAEDGQLASSFIYYPLNGGEPYRYTTIYDDDFCDCIATQNPRVIELCTYTPEGAYMQENHIPFLVMNGPRAEEINGEILRYCGKMVQSATFSWSLHGEILSLAINAYSMYDAQANFVYTLSTRTFDDASREEVLAAAGMTEEEYNAVAGEMFEDQFFHLFLGGGDARLVYPSEVIEQSGTPENVADSVPYLEKDGSLWAYARIYQFAGSESNWYPVPISNHQFTGGYQAYRKAAEGYSCEIWDYEDPSATYGKATVCLREWSDTWSVKDVQVIRCEDGCEPSSLVSKAVYGNAPVYAPKLQEEFDGEDYHTFKFQMTVPEAMAEDLKNSGEYDTVVKELERNVYVLIAVDETHYAYLHLECNKVSEYMAQNATSLVRRPTIVFE